jgi:hypothetical protein
MTLTLLEFFGSATGVLGALILAIKPHHALYAWCLWLFSATCLFFMALGTGQKYLMLLEATFVAINLLGIRNSLASRRQGGLILSQRSTK